MGDFRRSLLGSLLIGALFTGCSATTVDHSSLSQLDVEVRNAPRVYIAPEARRASEAIHNYLVGQYAYRKGDLLSAKEHLQRTSELLTRPAPVVHARLAELYLQSGQLEEALQETERALDAKPTDVFHQLLKAGILESLDRYEEAEPIYLELIDQNPTRQDTYILLSSMYVRSGEIESARKLLVGLIERVPKSAIGHHFLGRVYEIEGRLKEALPHYRLAQKLDPISEEISQDLLRALVRDNNEKEARTVAEALIEQDPDNIVARRVLGHVALGKSEFREALTHLRVLSDVEEDPTSTRFRIALIQIEQGNYDEAIRELRLLLTNDPEHAEARYYLASVYAGRGLKREAVAELLKIAEDQGMYLKSRTFAAFLLRQDGELKKAEQVVRDTLRARPENSKLRSYLVLLLREAEKFEAAKAVLLEALEEDPENEATLFTYAIVLHDLDQEQDAISTMERVLSLNPQNSDALNYIAYTLAERAEELERAEQLVRRALAIRSDDGYYLDTLGWVLFKQGRVQEALVEIQKAVKFTSDDAVILEHLGDVLARLGKKSDARDAYARAFEAAKLADEEQEVIDRIESKLDELRSKDSE